MNAKKTLLCLALTAALSACGGSGTSLNTGTFLDGPVGGIGYSTETQQGVTDAAGQFNYVEGEHVTFSIGKITLPSAPAAAVVTPLDLANTHDASDSKVTNILVLLQSLDEDGDPSNGISIPSTAAAKATEAVDFNVPVDTFRGNAAVTTLVANAGGKNTEPVTEQEANSHFETTVKAQDINVQPVANAGTAQNVTAGATVTLDGSGSTDTNGDALTYAWTVTGTPTGSSATLSSATAAKPTFVADAAGEYTFSLVVNDGALDSGAATVTVTAAAGNSAPVAKAGSAQSVTANNLVTLDGSGSSDADADTLTYAWTMTSKPTGSGATLSSATAAKPTFTPDVAGDYVFSLVVNDGTVDSSASTVTVTAAAANAAPVANAGSAQNVTANNLVTLDGSASSDANGDTLTYAWTVTSKPTGSSATLSSATAQKPTFTPDVAGDYVFSLVVNDGTVDSSASTVTVTAAAQTVTVAAKVVDPYVEGAVFCVDANRNKSCDTGETRSSASDANGAISFTLDSALPADSMIVADTTSMGKHNGVAFDLAMSALVAQGADGFVISPMTSMQGASATVASGQVSASLTAQDVADLLNTAGLKDAGAGLTGLSASDITADPMVSLKALSGSTFTDDNLAQVRGALAAYGFMQLFNSSNALKSLTPAEIKASGADTTSGAVYKVLNGMVTAIKSVVSHSLVVQTQTAITTANNALTANSISVTLPTVTAEVIVKAGVAIIDQVAATATAACNASSGDYNAGLQAAGTLVGNAGFNTTVYNLGQAYYGALNKTALQSARGYLVGQADEVVKGIDCTSGDFKVASDLTFSCVQ